MLAENIKRFSKNSKVTIMCHDWGSTITFVFVKKYPNLVKRLISLDVGGTIVLGSGMLVSVLSY